MSSDTASSNYSSSSSGSYSDQDGSGAAASSPASSSSSGCSERGRAHPNRRKRGCRTSMRLRTSSRCVEARTLLEKQIWQSKASTAWLEQLPARFRNRDTRKLKMLFPCAGLDAPGRALRCMGVRYELAGLWEIHEPLFLLLRNMYPDQQDKLHLGFSGDVLRRRPEAVPDAEGLVCGPPCKWVHRIAQESWWRNAHSAVLMHIIEWIRSLARRGLLFFVLDNSERI